MPFHRSRLPAFLLLPWGIACGGGGDPDAPADPGGPDDPPGSEPAVATVTVSPASAELGELGATRDFQAEARDPGGSVISGVSFAWTSTRPSVADVDGDGTVTARSNGGTEIVAEAEGVSGRARLAVRAGELVWRQLGGGPFNTCGVTSHGTVHCWGSNRHFQLGDRGGSRASPVRIESDLYFVEARTSGQACALTDAGRAYCWGANPFGERGDGTMDPDAPDVVAVAATSTFRQLTAGGNHTCGVTTQDGGLCWGFNGRGQLGDGTTTNRSTPTAPVGDLALRHVSAGRSAVDNHTCGVTVDGAAYCWGPNDAGELGDGTTADRTEPVRVATEASFERISAGGRHTCALDAGGTVHCWGANDAGQLGDGTTSDRAEPVPVAGGPTFRSVSAGDRHTCALAEGGEAYCWGAAPGGQSDVPALVDDQLLFDQLHSGANHICAVTADGVAYCWGANDDGQLGDGTTSRRQGPARVADPGGS